jgi:hypothetical protein
MPGFFFVFFLVSDPDDPLLTSSAGLHTQRLSFRLNASPVAHSEMT